jgi:UDP-N-acetylglucosamine transferase subunit ALG13
MGTLLVASSGGHLKELHNLHRRLGGVEGPFRWVTFDTPQSRSMLAGEAVEFVPFVGGRDPRGVGRNLGEARRVLRDRELDTVVSTGSSVALPYFALARARGLACHYIESAARIEGPSLTGKLISGVPGVRRYAQYRAWAGERWQYRGSVFDAFAPGEERPVPQRPQRIVITLGTYRGYSFVRVVKRLRAILPAGAEVLWQTGDTDVGGLGIEGHYAIPEAELTAAMGEADVVIAHAGVGTALAAFEVGKCPLLVPRRHAHGEHVDDHQIQIADELAARDLAVSVDADELGFADLERAAARSVTRPPQAPTFETLPARSRRGSPSA